MTEHERTALIICAGGQGTRANFGYNKLLHPLDGETVLSRTLRVCASLPFLSEIVIGTGKDDIPVVQELVSSLSLSVSVVEGGKTRAETVWNAMQSLDKKTEYIIVHDGARPYASASLFSSVLDSAKKFGSGIAALPVTDTVAVTKEGKILSVPDRSTLYAIQTPQAFVFSSLYTAYEKAVEEKVLSSFTDDSSVYRKYIDSPRVCLGEAENIKLTFASDFKKKDFRVGFGIDTHAFGKEQDYIVLGGVKIPSSSGLVAHSDGDVLCHAVMDALLSSVGLKDIGHYFPDTDDKWKGASSVEMLKTVLSLVKKQGYRPSNLSVSVQAERPKLKNYIDNIKENLSAVLDIEESRIGVAAGTNEGLGYVGEGKGITVSAYVGVIPL